MALVEACRFCWGLHKGNSPNLCQMLFSKSYVTQVSLNPKKFLLQKIHEALLAGWAISTLWVSVYVSSLNITDISRPSLAAPPPTPTTGWRWRREPKRKGVKVGGGHRAHVSLGITQIWSWEPAKWEKGPSDLRWDLTQGVHTDTNELRSFISDFSLH